MTHHTVERKLLGLEGEWVPMHRDLARAGRFLCGKLSEVAVLSIVLELWQEQQSHRSTKDLSPLVEVSVRAVYRELQVAEPKSTTTVRRVLEDLVRRGVLADTGDRGRRQVRVLSVQPLIDAVRPPHRVDLAPGPTDTRTPDPDRVPDGPERGRSRTRNRVDPAPGHRVPDGPPSERETSPPCSGGEERSRVADGGRAGPKAQPPPAPDERGWHAIQRALRQQRDAALSGTTHRRSLTTLLDRAERRDLTILRVPAVAAALRESQRLAVPA